MPEWSRWRTPGAFQALPTESATGREGAPEGGVGEDMLRTQPGRNDKVPAGEFILGFPGVGRRRDAIASTFRLWSLSRDQQEVVPFRTYLAEQAALLAGVGGSARRLCANVSCRQDVWPLARRVVDDVPRWAKARAGQGNGFGYADPTGARCPRGAHIRRAYGLH